LLKRDFAGLIALVAVWLVHLVISFMRQRLDARVFMGLYASIASHIVGLQRGHGTSTVSARVEMMRDVVGFSEREVPALLQNVVAIVGSLAMLFVYDADAGLIAMTVLLSMGLVNAWHWRKALRLNQGINNQIEREVDAIVAVSSQANAAHGPARAIEKSPAAIRIRFICQAVTSRSRSSSGTAWCVCSKVYGGQQNAQCEHPTVASRPPPDGR
jgi:ABC transporter transmembrane region